MEFINLKAQYEYIQDDINHRIQAVMKGGHFILAEEVQIFEKKISEYVGRKYAVSCGNGTEALQLIYMAYGIGKGAAVFCPDMTFIASIEPAVMLGAHPVFCDIDLNSYNIEPSALEYSIKKVIEEGIYRPRAIVAVDFLGHPFNLEAVSVIAKKYNLLLIEDAAQGIGARMDGKMCGAFGDISATSFFPTKPLGCYGDGGAVFTDDEEMYKILLSLRVHGKGKNKYDNIRIGMNSRLDSIQAAVLLAKMEILEEELQNRQKNARKYDKALQNHVTVPRVSKKCVSSFAQYVVLAANTEQRKYLVKKLSDNNIPSVYYYPTPMHQLPVFKHLMLADSDYPNAIEYCNRAFGLPFSPYLSDVEQKMVTDIIVDSLED